LAFYQTEAKDKIAIIIDFMLKRENFEKLDKTIGAKDPMARTNDETGQYNKAIKELNAATNNFNMANNYLNQNRKNAIDNWNNTSQSFLERYVPKYN